VWLQCASGSPSAWCALAAARGAVSFLCFIIYFKHLFQQQVHVIHLLAKATSYITARH
jgi:hypothetical protein